MIEFESGGPLQIAYLPERRLLELDTWRPVHERFRLPLDGLRPYGVADALAAPERRMVYPRRMHPVVDLTRRLVAIPCENPPGNHYAECVALLEAELERLDLKPRRITELILEASVGEGDRPLYFHGHYDVVPAQDRSQFEPYIEGDRLYGRGTADMKGGLAAMIHAMVALRDAPGRVVLHLVPDEETGGERGSRLLEDLDGIGMLTTEPTSGVVWNANRGALSMRVTTRGKSAHVGLAHTGVNAFERMVELVNRLQGLRDEVRDASILLIGGTIDSGANFNVVPDSCTMTLDRRPNPDESVEAEKQRLLDLLAGADVEIFQEAPSAASPDDGPVAHALADAVAELEGERPRFEMCPGLLETRWYAQRGIPAYAYGPGALEVAHQADEHVEIPRLLRAVDIYVRTATALLGAGEARGPPRRLDDQSFRVIVLEPAAPARGGVIRSERGTLEVALAAHAVHELGVLGERDGVSDRVGHLSSALLDTFANVSQAAL